MMMKAGQPKTGISEAQSGSVGQGSVGAGEAGPWRNDRWCLTPGLVSPDLPFWAIILICLAGLLVLIMGLISFFLVSKEVLFSYYQVVRAFYILEGYVLCGDVFCRYFLLVCEGFAFSFS